MRKEPFFRTRRRAISFLLSALLVLTLLLGVAFVLVELHHDCIGEGCAICAAIAQDVAYLKADSAEVLPPLLVTICQFAILCAAAMPQLAYLQKPSPVTLKVKLSD